MESIHSQHFWILSSCALFAGLASAQSLEDELGELASEAVSVFTSVTSEVVSMWTELTSIVANAPASTNPAASSATATPASSLAPESSSIVSKSAAISSASSPLSSAISSLASSSQSSLSQASSSSVFSSASSALSSPSSSLDSTSSRTSSHSSARSTGSSSTSDPSSSSATSQVAASSPNSDSNLSSSHHSHPNVVGIVVGTIVGALVLGLVILLALLCLRRRRRRRRRRTGVSPTDAEVDSWRNTHEAEYAFLGPGTERATGGHDNVMAAAAVPTVSERSMHNRHHNPFAPAPPPPRRVAANSRPGLINGAVPGQMPFDAAAVRNSEVHPAYRGDAAAAARSPQHHSLGEEMAVGAGGALLGAAAMKHHNDKDRRKESIEMPADRTYTPRRHSVQRKPVGAAVPNWNEDTSAESTLLNNRQSLDHQDGGYKSGIVSPISPTEPAELPSPSYDRAAAGGDNEPLLGGRGEKAAGLFALAASANRRNHDRNRPAMQRASSSDYDDEVPKMAAAAAAGQSSNRPSYQSYQPQDSPTLATSASSSYPTTRSPSTPDVPARSPARASFRQDTPPTDSSSSDSLSKASASAPSSARRRSASVEAAEAAMERDEAADQVSDTLIPAMWRRSADGGGGARMPPKGVTYHDFKAVRRENVSTGYNNSSSAGAGSHTAAPHPLPSSAALRRLSDRSGAYAQLTGGGQQNPFAGSPPRDSRRVSLSELIEEEKRLEAARQRRNSRGSGAGSPWHSGAATPTEAYEGRGYGVGQAL